MSLQPHPNYQHLVAKSAESHAAGRSVTNITESDIGLARLYCYAFRAQTIGAFHATRQRLASLEQASGADPFICRAVELLGDLANMAVEPVFEDSRAVISTFHRYDAWIRRVLRELELAQNSNVNTTIASAHSRFAGAIQRIVACNGVYVTSDLETPEQASFVVPNLGITIVPLVYGDHHSWNVARLSRDHQDVPPHRHRHGVEIHLGFSPVRGYMVLGKHRALAEEGYALAIPPNTSHGYINASSQVHDVPFIFGSLKFGGWGVFFDVEPCPCTAGDLQEASWSHWMLRRPALLEREIDKAKTSPFFRRWTITKASATSAGHIGTLKLSIARVTPDRFAFPTDTFRAISVLNGRGIIQIVGQEQVVAPHDHFGIPARLGAVLRQIEDQPLVVLDAVMTR